MPEREGWIGRTHQTFLWHITGTQAWSVKEKERGKMEGRRKKERMLCPVVYGAEYKQNINSINGNMLPDVTNRVCNGDRVRR